MTKAIARREPSDLARPYAVRPDQNPCLAYLGSISEKNSRPTMHHALRRAIKLLGSTFEPERFPWNALRATHTAFLRAELLDLPPATANQTMAAVRGVLKWCWRFELIQHEDYARAIDVLATVKGDRLPMGRYLPREEIDAMLRACGDSEVGLRNRTIVLMLANSGLRREEIASLKLSDFNLVGTDPSFTVIGKGNKQRKVFINEELLEAINEWLSVRGHGPGPFLIAASMQGKLLRGDRAMEHLDNESVFAAIEKLCNDSGLQKVTPHDFRRTFISNMLDESDVGTVSKIVGHSDPKTTLRYDRRGERVQREAMKHARGRK